MKLPRGQHSHEYEKRNTNVERIAKNKQRLIEIISSDLTIILG